MTGGETGGNDRPRDPRSWPLLAALVLGAGCARPVEDAERPPNLVLLISDDHDWEHLGLTGHPAGPTPAIDALAARGAVFERAYVAPRCRPTLAGLLSGRPGHQTGVYANGARTLLRGPKLLPRLLARAGYRTYAEGKFWEGDPREVGFRHGPRQSNGEYGLRTDTFVRQDQRELFAFLSEPSEQPFFVWWAPRLPHTPHDPPEALRARFAETPIEPPEWIRAEDREAFVEAERTALAMAAWLDRGVGELVEHLERIGELERTLLVFLIDNGWANGHLSKGTPYEKGIRTPLVLAGPGVPAGYTSEALVSYLDVMPTLLDWAGVPAPERCVGASLRPVLAQGARPEDAGGPLCGALYPKSAGESHRPERDLLALWAREGRWKYVTWVADLEASRAAEQGVQHRFLAAPERARGTDELYDLESDPYERNDLSELAEHAERRRALRAAAFDWWTRTGGGPIR